MTASDAPAEEVLSISIARRIDGGIRVWSDDIPGLVLSGSDPDKVMADIWPAIQVILAYRPAAPDTAPQIIGAFLMHLGQPPWEAEELIAWLQRGGFEIVRSAAREGIVEALRKAQECINTWPMP